MSPAHRLKVFFHRVTHWEYWPFGVLYLPIYFVWFYYALRARHLFFGTAANPGIENGGFLMESKKKIYDRMPRGSSPATLRFVPESDPEIVQQEIFASGIGFPMILKPDIGMKGLGTTKVDDVTGLQRCIGKMNVPYLVQPFIPFENEAGIFYVRVPGQPSGKITGMVLKEFVTVTGDGASTLHDLVAANPRYLMQLPALAEVYGKRMTEVVAAGSRVLLSPYGNHARGARFTDGTHLVSEALTGVIDRLCKQVPGFYFGRLDVKYASLEELEQGINFSVIELNGSGSEPAHIYDPRHSVFYAWKEISRHLKYMFSISRLNMLQGVRPMSASAGLAMLRSNRQHLKKLNRIP